jgi:hypothetical protein
LVAGLPLVRIYAKYFGGDLKLQTLEGHGTDVYLRLAHLDPSGAAFALDGAKKGAQHFRTMNY